MNEQYNNPYDSFNNPMPVKKPAWAAITGFVLSIVNVVFCCCMTYILAPLSLVFAIISLAKKWACKGLAIAAVIISSIALIFTISSNLLLGGVTEDLTKFASKGEQYIQEYQESGEIPEEFQKYSDPKYDNFWKSIGYDSFEDFYRDFIDGYISGSNGGNSFNDDGESHIDI